MPYYKKRKKGLSKKFREHIVIFSCSLAGCILLAFILVYLMMPSRTSLIMKKERGSASTISNPLLPYLSPTLGDASDKNKESKKFAVPYQKGKVQGNVEVEFGEGGEVKKILIK